MYIVSIARCIAEQTAHLEREYLRQCANSDNVGDTLIISYPIDYYHFTVYTYDRAGNLVRTAPPRGIQLYSWTTRMSGLWHRLSTQYEYNSLGQLTKSFTPDGDSSWVWYDQWGRPRFSQERRQADSGVYAYVKYDELGRVVESGTSSAEISGHGFVAGARTYYSYDEHGNLAWLSQEIPGFPVVNYLKYEYELVSGNLLKTIYNEGRSDAWHHQYLYDADNRIAEVRTSRDGYIWDRDARYGYHTMGSLARREIGEDSLQGLDYTYTLQGWLKAVNHPSLNAANDPGSDGAGSGFPADSFAVELGYYRGDYVRAGSSLDSSASTGLRGAPLYGGNISSSTSHIGKKTGARYEQLTGEVYRYDQLEQLKSSDFRFDLPPIWWTGKE